MLVRWILALALVLGVFAVVTRAMGGQVPAPRVATFEIKPDQSSGFEEEGAILRLRAAEGTLVSQRFSPGWEFMALGVTWDQDLAGGVPSIEVRVSEDGRVWTDWTALAVSSEERPDRTSKAFTDLHFTRGRHAEVRAYLQNATGAPLEWRNLQLTLLDGRPGPASQTLSAGVDASGEPHVIPRAEWGANERYRYRNNEEIWPRTFYPLKGLIVHGTASPPNDTDPAAALRTIYYYHAVTLGWGDIGYHYVIDQFGNIYEGRYRGEQEGQVAEAGHTLGYNRETLGVAIIGTYQRAAPSDASMTALKELLAWRAARYGIDPLAPVRLDGAGPISPDRWFDHALMAHRDSHTPPRTIDPGDAFYARMDEIRSDVAARIAEISQPDQPTVDLVRPAPNTKLEGLITLEAIVTPNVVRVDYFLDGSLIASRDARPWQVEVDSASLPAGSFTLSATGVTAARAKATDSHTIEVAPVIGLAIGGAAGDAEPGKASSAGVPLTTGSLYLPLATGEPVCNQLVTNSTFETNTEWLMLMGAHAARYTDEQVQSGSRSLRVGLAPGDNVEAWSSARLPLTLPDATGARKALLTLHYLSQTDNQPDTDRQYIGLLDPSGTYIASIVAPGLRHEPDWQQVSFDLTPFRGQTLFLYIGTYNDGGGNRTRLYVDDVEVTVCP